LDHIVNKEAPPIPNRWSTQFQDFIDMCLQKEPDARYTAEQLLDHEFLSSIEFAGC